MYMHLTFLPLVFCFLYNPTGQHSRLCGQPVGDLLPGECRGHPGPECSLPGAAQGLGETLLSEYNTGLRKWRGHKLNLRLCHCQTHTHTLLHGQICVKDTYCALFPFRHNYFENHRSFFLCSVIRHLLYSALETNI